MWWPLINPVDEDIELSGLKRIGYILGKCRVIDAGMWIDHLRRKPYICNLL